MKKFAHSLDMDSIALYFETIKMHTANFFLPVCRTPGKPADSSVHLILVAFAFFMNA